LNQFSLQSENLQRPRPNVQYPKCGALAQDSIFGIESPRFAA
jgi:hypothetical protein